MRTLGSLSRVAPRMVLLMAMAFAVSSVTAGPSYAAPRNAARTTARAASVPFHELVPRGAVHTPALGAQIAAASQPLSPAASLSSSVFQRFSGLPYDAVNKPDDNVAAGPTNIVEMINSRWAAFSKAGTLLSSTTLKTWYNNEQGGIFDPRAVYDARVGRFFMINLRYDSSGTGYVDLSTSATSSATGSWCQYHFLVQDNNNQPDFPGLGYDGQALYVTMNMYPIGSNTFQYAKVLGVNEAQLAQCATTVSTFTFTRLQNADGTMAESVQPAQTLDSEPAEYLVNAGQASRDNFITLWTLANPTTSPTLTSSTISVHQYSTPPAAPQGTRYTVHTGGTALLQATVRAGKLWTAHTTGLVVNSTNYAAAQWFELDAANRAVVQQQSYAVSGSYAYMPAITATSDGAAFMVYDVSNKTTYVSVDYAARKSADPAGQLPATGLIQSGLGPYAYTSGATAQPWGDFFSVTVDPSDTTKVWICAEYATANNQWATAIAEIGY